MTTRKVLLRLGRRGRLVRVVEAVNHGDPVYVVTWTAGGKRRAKFFPRPRRGAHGLRRLLAGEVNERTGNPKLAMDAIGDRDIRMADRYLRPREDRVREAFEAMDQGNDNGD